MLTSHSKSQEATDERGIYFELNGDNLIFSTFNISSTACDVGTLRYPFFRTKFFVGTLHGRTKRK